MPYDIVKVSRDGYKVCKPDSNKCFSKKPLPLERAKKQQAALYASETKTKQKKYRKMETQPTGTYKVVISANATGEGSPKLELVLEKRDAANYISRIMNMPATQILNNIPAKGVTTFGQPVKVVLYPASMTGAGLFDWLKKKAGQAVQAVSSGLSKVIDNISTNTTANAGELGDSFMKAQTKIFSPSGTEDEPGIPPEQVIQNFQPNPLMPTTKILFQMNKNSYDNSTANVDPGWVYLDGTPTLKLYENGPGIVVAVRGTADQRDLITDLTIAAQDMENQSRYTQDRDFIRSFQTRYPPSQYTYLLTGHSLGGAICDQLMKDGIGVQAITFNPAVQKEFYNSQNNKRIYQADDPLYRMMGRYCKYNVEVRSNRQQSALEQALSYVPFAGVGYTALQAHSLDNYVGGMKLDDLPFELISEELMPILGRQGAAKLAATSKKMKDAYKEFTRYDDYDEEEYRRMLVQILAKGQKRQRGSGMDTIATSIEDRPCFRQLVRPY